MTRSRTTPAEAERVITALLERRFDGELPALSTGSTYFEVTDHLPRLPPAEALPLYGRALFAPTSLAAGAREQALWGLAVFFAELGAAVGLSARVLLAAVRARRFPLAPPRPVDGYEHPKFGTGAVIGAADGKIDVQFDDDTRTLVHGRR